MDLCLPSSLNTQDVLSMPVCITGNTVISFSLVFLKTWSMRIWGGAILHCNSTPHTAVQ